jgi:hypothetical protein
MRARRPGPSFAAAMRGARGQTSIEYAGVLAVTLTAEGSGGFNLQVTVLNQAP